MKDRIKLVRTNANLNIRQFGECIGTTPASVSRYESGERIPSNAVLLAISREFHVSLAWLKTGEGPMMDPLPDEASIRRLTDTYMSLPERLKTLVDALAEMDPEWYRTLDEAFEEIEKRRKHKRDAD
ncbi:MAG: helix-turn-helix transcriptional regulator [Clostridia bacterium]|nr:helix-turn-helix transcriptional regulator [Clostridia bacterium]